MKIARYSLFGIMLRSRSVTLALGIVFLVMAAYSFRDAVWAVDRAPYPTSVWVYFAPIAALAWAGYMFWAAHYTARDALLVRRMWQLADDRQRVNIARELVSDKSLSDLKVISRYSGVSLADIERFARNKA